MGKGGNVRSQHVDFHSTVLSIFLCSEYCADAVTLQLRCSSFFLPVVLCLRDVTGSTLKFFPSLVLSSYERPRPPCSTSELSFPNWTATY